MISQNKNYRDIIPRFIWNVQSPQNQAFSHMDWGNKPNPFHTPQHVHHCRGCFLSASALQPGFLSVHPKQ